MESSRFDYIIIGNGLAGLQLALSFAEDPLFNSKKIALIDPSRKLSNDKTWCFWEEGNGKWDHIVTKSWSSCKFYSSKKAHNIDLANYSYKMIRALDFYEYSKALLEKRNNFTFIIDTIESIDELNAVGQKNTYQATHIFDSRIPNDYFKENDGFTRIFQHFKGWIIETERDIFNPDTFTVMDYRVKYKDDTTFTYVLPLSPRKALVEFTFFTPYTVEDDSYDIYLEKYIKEILGIDKFKVEESEQGVIPMTNFNFNKYNTNTLTKIGTGGGWVKGSTGYSFKHTEKKVAQILDNLKSKRLVHHNLNNPKFKFYDKIFLKVLKDANYKGEWIFEQFYTKNDVNTMFRFLDEESNFSEDIRIMLSLFSGSFIKAFFKSL